MTMSKVTTLYRASSSAISEFHTTCDRFMKRLAQRMLERSYTIVRPPRRFTPNQVDQSMLLTVYWATIMLAVSVLLSGACVIWAFMSSPVPDIENVPESKQDGNCAIIALVGNVVVMLL